MSYRTCLKSQNRRKYNLKTFNSILNPLVWLSHSLYKVYGKLSIRGYCNFKDIIGIK